MRAGQCACAKARPPLIPKPKEERNPGKDSNAGTRSRLGHHYQDVAESDHQRERNDRSSTRCS